MVTQTLGTAQFREGITRDVLTRKEQALERTQRRNQALQTIRNTAEAAKLKREQDLEDQKSQREFEVAMTVFKDRLAKETDPLEREKLVAEINTLYALEGQRKAQTSKLAAEEKLLGKGKGLTEAQRLANERALERISLAERKDERAKQSDLLGMEEDIMADPGAGEVLPLIEHINKTQNKPYYYIQYTEDASDYIPFNENVTGKRITLPTIQGRQLTMDMVRKGAEAAGLSVKDYLAHPTIGILKKVGEDYIPVES